MSGLTRRRALATGTVVTIGSIGWVTTRTQPVAASISVDSFTVDNASATIGGDGRPQRVDCSVSGTISWSDVPTDAYCDVGIAVGNSISWHEFDAETWQPEDSSGKREVSLSGSVTKTPLFATDDFAPLREGMTATTDVPLRLGVGVLDGDPEQSDTEALATTNVDATPEVTITWEEQQRTPQTSVRMSGSLSIVSD